MVLLAPSRPHRKQDKVHDLGLLTGLYIDVAGVLSLLLFFAGVGESPVQAFSLDLFAALRTTW